MSGARLLHTVQQQQSNRLMQNPDIKHINSLDMTIQENHNALEAIVSEISCRKTLYVAEAGEMRQTDKPPQKKNIPLHYTAWLVYITPNEQPGCFHCSHPVATAKSLNDLRLITKPGCFRLHRKLQFIPTSISACLLCREAFRCCRAPLLNDYENPKCHGFPWYVLKSVFSASLQVHPDPTKGNEMP